MPDPQSVRLTGNDEIDALLTGYKWDSKDLTYSFPNSGAWYVLESIVDDLDPLDIIDFLSTVAAHPGASLVNLLQESFGQFVDTAIVSFFALNDFGKFTESQQAAAEAAHANLEGFTRLNFTKVDEGDFFFDIDIFPPDIDVGFTHGLIRYAESGAISASAPGFGIPPLPTAEILIGEGILGDTWYLSDGSFDSALPGSFAAFTIMHETGHAIGLKHAHEAGLLGGNVPEVIEDVLTGVSGPIMPQAKESVEFSIMSYKSTVGGNVGYTNEDNGYPTTYMMLDIQALQYMYGANFAHNNGDTVYQWNPTTGEFSINGVGQGAPAANRVFMTLWDGGGIDTYDLSNYSDNTSINLRPGEWTTTSKNQLADLTDSDGRASGLAHGNVANALLYRNNPASLIENATGGSGADTILGNDLANVLIGNGGADFLMGGIGADTLDGGAGTDFMGGGDGNDLYVVDNAGDVTWEPYNNAQGGRDTVESSVTYTLGFGIEDLILTGGEAINGTGNGNNNIIAGNNANNVLSGLAGNDVLAGVGGDDQLNGDDGKDQLIAGSGDDLLNGGSDNDSLLGQDGDDQLNGGTGADYMNGGKGNDTYIVDNVGDQTAEDFNISQGGGWDVVKSSVTYTLGSGIEYLTLTGGAAINGTGNGDSNFIVGNNANNRLAGLGDNDTLFGYNGHDTLIGGAGADDMHGGPGNDLYVVDNAGDRTVEDSNTTGGGVDTVESYVTNTRLSFGLENLILSGAAINGQGNGNNNAIDGNAADNTLAGLGGKDEIYGVGGNDNLFGGDNKDFLSGGYGNDLLNGGADRDTLTGNSGNDTFHYNATRDSLPGAALRDVITDFRGLGAAFGDQIDLRPIDANVLVGGNQSFSWGGPFTAGHLYYASGVLSGNTDTDAAVEFQIQLVGAPALFVNQASAGTDIFL